MAVSMTQRATTSLTNDSFSRGFCLTLPERLDRASASILASTSERIVASEVQRLSFARTRRLESAGLEALRLFCLRAHSLGARVSLEELSLDAYSVLSMCGFASICDLLLAPEDDIRV